MSRQDAPQGLGTKNTSRAQTSRMLHTSVRHVNFAEFPVGDVVIFGSFMGYLPQLFVIGVQGLKINIWDSNNLSQPGLKILAVF